tara:strand:+ start:1223 stop:2353 length:1131 start_codon:yes stop_codon:yes gene_type:complete
MEDEPPDPDESNKNLERIFLEPNPDLGEIATINPSSIPFPVNGSGMPFLYRSEATQSEKPFQELTPEDRESSIILEWLEKPYKLTHEKRVILASKQGVSFEDPDIARIDNEFYISAVRYDGENAQVNLFTSPDLEQITDRGIISPNISLKRAIAIVGNEKYKQIWGKEYHGRLRRLVKMGEKGKWIYQNLGVLLWDKNQILSKPETEIEKIHRLVPDIHLAVAKNISDFQNTEYQEDYLAHIKEHTLLRAEDLGYERIGIRARAKLGDKIISLLHGVHKRAGVPEYETRLCEIKNRKIPAITPPILIPTEQDIFRYMEGGEVKTKMVAYGSTLIVDEDADRVWVYYNSGDRVTKVQEFSATRAYEQLNHSANRVAA